MNRLGIAVGLLFGLGHSMLLADVVVLRNGNVLAGQTDLVGNQIVVNTGTAEVRLERSDIEDIAPTMVAAYERKRSRLPHPTAGQHLALADWCMRQSLWPQAALELNDARLRDARHPSLAMLEARLRVAAEAAQRSASQVPAPAAAPVAPQSDTDVRELQQLAANTDPAVIEEFTRHLQPLLAHNCTTSGCHAVGAGRPFEMTRDVIHNTASRNSTLRNLQTVMAQVDRENPAASPLVTQPAGPHGSLAGPVFTGRRAKLQSKLVDWVYLAAGAKPPGAALETAETTALALPDATAANTAAGFDADVPGSADAPLQTHIGVKAAATAAPEAKVAHFWELEQQPVVRPVANTPPAQPRDEFDPAEFNRRYHGDKP